MKTENIKSIKVLKTLKLERSYVKGKHLFPPFPREILQELDAGTDALSVNDVAESKEEKDRISRLEKQLLTAEKENEALKRTNAALEKEKAALTKKVADLEKEAAENIVRNNDNKESEKGSGKPALKKRG